MNIRTVYKGEEFLDLLSDHQLVETDVIRYLLIYKLFNYVVSTEEIVQS
jgi:hypothetical protein